MSDQWSNWLFNFSLKLAACIFLAILAICLAVGVGPLTALLRSGTAFLTFSALGWAIASLLTLPPQATDEAEESEMEEETTANEKTDSTTVDNKDRANAAASPTETATQVAANANTPSPSANNNQATQADDPPMSAEPDLEAVTPPADPETQR